MQYIALASSSSLFKRATLKNLGMVPRNNDTLLYLTHVLSIFRMGLQ